MSLTIRSFVIYTPPISVWYVLYDNTTGELLSLGTVVPDSIPAGTTLVGLSDQPDLTVVIWDTTVRAFVLRTPDTLVDRAYDDLPAEAGLATMWAQLDATQKEVLKSRIATLLGSYRYRFTYQPTDLD